MTIALGILAADGVVIAADTQEGTGYAGGTKTVVRKIYTRLDPSEDRAVSVTGAGGADYLDAANQYLAEEFIQAKDYVEAEQSIKDGYTRFYKEFVLPLHVLPREQQQAVESVVGFTWGNEIGLLSGSQMVLHRAREFAIVGAGRQHASMLMNSIYPIKHDLDVELAAYFAAYVVFHTKQFVEGVGSGTHVTILQRGSGRYLSEWVIQELEQCFKAYLGFEGVAVNYLLGRELSNERKAPAALASELKTIKERIEQIAPPPGDFDLNWKQQPRTPQARTVFQTIQGPRVVTTRSSRSRSATEQ